MQNIFFDIGVLFIAGTVLAFGARMFRQPLIPAYVLAGILIGPVLGFLAPTESMLTLSEIGIAFLLFVVGLELDLRRLTNVALVTMVGGFAKTAVMFLVGLVVGRLMGFTGVESVYIGLILSFSSTMVVVKLLADKKELETLHGRMVIGILLLEDVIAIIALTVLSSLGSISVRVIASEMLLALIAILVAVLLSKTIFPAIFKFAASSRELLFMSALAVCFAFAMVAKGMGFSIAIGSFIAGIALANLPYTIEISSKIMPLRNFFSIIFFTSLGLELQPASFGHLLLPIVVLTVCVVLLKPMLVMGIVGIFGYKKRPSFLTAINLSQVSEFSFIIVAQGLIMGHVSQDIVTITVALTIITITLTTYLIKYDDAIYQRLARFLVFFKEVHTPHDIDSIPKRVRKDVVLCGFDRLGYAIYQKLKEMKRKVLIIDFNPEVIRKLRERREPCIYGDVGDGEVLEKVGLGDAKLVISTIEDKKDNLMLIQKTRTVNKDAFIFVTANFIDSALELYDAGADYVIMPHFLGGDQVAVILEKCSFDLGKVRTTKERHIQHLRYHKTLGKEHPIHRGLPNHNQ